MDQQNSKAVVVIAEEEEEKKEESSNEHARRSQNFIIHKVQEVRRAPRTSILQEFMDRSKETLFPDDPFRKFKKQPKHRKCIMGLLYIFPILEWLPSYKLSYLKNDIIAGITIASLSIPQSIAYARLANLPPVLGLYTCVVPPLVYAFLGSSKDIAMGPEAVMSILLGTLVKAELGPAVTDVRHHVSLALTATFFAGVFQASLGVFRLGFIIDFLSHAATVGFMSGASLIVALEQFKGILGIQNFTHKSDIISVSHSIAHHPSQWNWRTILLGIFFCAFLLGARAISRRNKKLFWVSAIAPVTSVIMATLVIFISRGDKHQIGIVGHLRKGLNPPSVNELQFHGPFLAKGMKIGLIVGFIGLMQAILVGRTFASLKNYHIDGNKEMIATGMVNIIGPCMSCYVISAAMSRTAVNSNAGCKTPVSSIVMAVIVMITLLVLTPLFYYTPNVILSVIIFCALVSLVDPVAAYEIWKIDKIDFFVYLGAFLGVIFHSIPLGLALAVAISLCKVLLQVTRPHLLILGKIPGTNMYRNIKQYSDGITVPGILIIGIDNAIYFLNANYIRERIIRWVEEHQAETVKFLILDLTAVMNIDTSGINSMVEIQRSLQLMNIQLCLANPGAEVLEKLHRSKYIDLLGQQWIFVSVDEAFQYSSMRLPKVETNKGFDKDGECEVIVQMVPKFGF